MGCDQSRTVPFMSLHTLKHLASYLMPNLLVGRRREVNDPV